MSNCADVCPCLPRIGERSQCSRLADLQALARTSKRPRYSKISKRDTIGVFEFGDLYGMRRALAYIRVSTDEQGRSGFGLLSQEAEIKAFADQTGFKIVRWERDVASVIGGSSVSARPGLSSLIAEAKKRRFPILISRLDRLSRDPLEIEDLAISSGVEILSVRNPGLQDPVAVRIQAQRVLVETNMLSERTKDGLRRAKAAGKTLGNVVNLAEAQKKAPRPIGSRLTNVQPSSLLSSPRYNPAEKRAPLLLPTS